MGAFSVITLEAVPTVVRGTLSRWMIEPSEGTFVGRLPASVRDDVWTLICSNTDSGRAGLIYPSDAEQGFSIKTFGESRRVLRDFDGVVLVQFT